jgi:RNA polymerase sigma factor (sigma-70 family)
MDELDSLIALTRSADASRAQRHEAFSELVRRYQDMAFGCAYAFLGDPHLAEDAAQEAFITAYQALAQLREPKAFPGWLRRIVLTQCNRLVRKRRVLTQPIEGNPDLRSDHMGTAEAMESQQMRERVLAAIQMLPDGQRLVTILFYINGYSQREIAGFLEVSVDAVKKRLQRARNRLRGRLLDMVTEDLRARRPSQDDQFVQTVQVSLALEEAALEGQLSMLELLLVDGIGINATIRDGQTLLHWAAQTGHLEAAELLLRHRADPHIGDNFGKTPLQWALEGDHEDVVRLLRRHTDQRGCE